MFIKTIQRFFDRSHRTSEEGTINELRVHTRYPLPSDEFLGILTLEDGSEHALKDISYGGIQTSIASNTPQPRDNRCFGKLSLLHRVIPVSLQCVHQNDDHCGFAFIHDTSDVLLFLREVLEGIRIGKTLSPTKASHLNEQITHGTSLYIGDGNSLVRIERQPGTDKLASFQISFRSGANGYDVRFSNDRLVTCIQEPQANPLNLSANVITTRDLDLNIVRQALAVAVGLTNVQESKLLVRQLNATLLQQHYQNKSSA